MPKNSGQLIKDFVDLLSKLRKEKGLTLDELADRAGIHRTTLGLIERNERTPTLETAFKLCAALNLPLSKLVSQIEHGNPTEEINVIERDYSEARHSYLKSSYFRNESKLFKYTGLTVSQLGASIIGCYKTLDYIDYHLVSRGNPPIAQIVELANFSSMMGNVFGSSIAAASEGLYQRNKPHSYPDLLPLRKPAVPVEIKVSLEKNRPKGHLPKAGVHLTVRYILASSKGEFKRGKESRSNTAWIWEIKVGNLTDRDYDISNTAGDSGKTAVIKTTKFNEMDLIYFVPDLLPYSPRKDIHYRGYN